MILCYLVPAKSPFNEIHSYPEFHAKKKKEYGPEQNLQKPYRVEQSQPSSLTTFLFPSFFPKQLISTMPQLTQFDYLFVIGTGFALLDAYNNGANE